MKPITVLSNRPENPRLSNLGMNGHLSKRSQVEAGGEIHEELGGACEAFEGVCRERRMVVESEARVAGTMEINYVSPIGRAI